MTLDEVKKKIKQLGYNFYYHPSTCTHIQANIQITQQALDSLVEDKFLEKVYVPKYGYNNLFEEAAALSIEACDTSELQDPNDYMPIDRADLDFVVAYRVIK